MYNPNKAVYELSNLTMGPTAFKTNFVQYLIKYKLKINKYILFNTYFFSIFIKFWL